MYREMPRFKPDEILVYLRKSRSDDPSMSVEEVLQKHESILREWAERNLDAPIPEENFYREVVSGETIDGRPEVQKILKRMENPRIKAILVVEVQRLSRGDLEDCGRLMKLLRYTHTKVITPMKLYDLEDEYDRDGFERELKRGNDYLEYFKRIQKRGIQNSTQDGNYLGTVAPYGYNKIKVTVGNRKYPTLEINEEEARIVRMIFDWYGNEGIGVAKICNRLNEMGLRTRKGTLWISSTIRTMLANEHYIGKVRWNYRVETHVVVEQEVFKKTKRNKDYNLYEGKHPAIIDEELFYKIQNKRAGMPKSRLNTTLQNPLSTLLYCKCGSCMNYKVYKYDVRFFCDKQKYCHNASVKYGDIMCAIIEYLKKSIEDFTVLADASDDKLYEQHQEHIAFLEKKLQEAEEKEIALWDKYTEEGMPRAVFEKLRAKCESDKQSIESALIKAYNSTPVKVDYKSIVTTLHKTIDTLTNDSCSVEMKNKMLRRIIDRIEYSRPPAYRLSIEEREKSGKHVTGGWHSPDFELDIRLLI